MNHKLLLLIGALCLFSIFPAALTQSDASSPATTATSDQPSEPTHEEELVLIPEVLDRLEEEKSDDTDLGPVIKQTDSDKSTQGGEPNLLDIEDDSDAVANIYKEKHPEATTNDNGDAEVEEDDFANGSNKQSSNSDIDATAAEIDGEYHDILLQSCSVVLIPINRQKVQVSLNAISNVEAAMITDKQLTDCSQLINYGCPAGAAFCRKLSLNFPDEDDGDINLGNEVCGVETVYLYMLPSDMDVSVSYQVKVQVTGEPKCTNDEDEPTLDQIIPTGKQSEEVNDDSTSSDNSDAIQQDLNEDPYQAFDNKILEEKEVINGKPRTFEVKVCTVVEIPINQQGVNIAVNDILNSQKVMVTDTQMSGCSDLHAFKCPPKNKFCKIQSTENPLGIKLITEACGVDTAYLYVLPDDFDSIVSYQVNTTVINKSPCKNKNPATPGTRPAAETTTVPNTKPNAKTSSEDETASPSKSKGANANTGSAAKNSDSSDSSDGSDDEDAAIADDVHKALTDNNSDNTDNQTADSNGDPSQAIGNPESKLDSGRIFLILFATSLAVFMAVVCCYRYQFRKNRVEMFSPPSWCPRCLFPRSNEGFINLRTAQKFDSDYEPPVL